MKILASHLTLFDRNETYSRGVSVHKQPHREQKAQGKYKEITSEDEMRRDERYSSNYTQY
jgi:putative aminopeptidase FrvX